MTAGLCLAVRPSLQKTSIHRSQRNPVILAYKDMEGPFNWDRTQMLSLGSKVVVFDNPGERTAWATHARDAHYIGHAPYH